MKRILIACTLVFCLCGIAIADGAKTEIGPQTVVGKEIVEVAKSVAGITDDFSKTAVGGMAYYALLWKLIIKPIFNILLGIPVWIILNYLILTKCDHFFGTERVIADSGAITYVRKFTFRDEGAVGAGATLAVLAGIVNLLGFFVVFS